MLHAPIDATLAAVKEHGIKSDEVESVVVRGSASNIFITTGEKKPASAEKYRHPKGVVDAQFSVHWAVAAAIARGAVFIDCFTEDAIKDPVINSLTDRIDLVADPSLDPSKDILAPAIVEITTKNRGTFFMRANFAKGNPSNPVSWRETEEAFHRSAPFAAKQITPQNIDRTISIIGDLEHVGDLRVLTAALGG